MTPIARGEIDGKRPMPPWIGQLRKDMQLRRQRMAEDRAADPPLTNEAPQPGPAEFLRALAAGCGGVIELRALPSRARVFIEPGDAVGRVRFVAAHQREDCYVGVATRRDASSGTAANCLSLGALFCDLDFKLAPEEEVRAALAAFSPPPSTLVASGGGLHGYWLLKEPLDVSTPAGRADAKQLLRRLVAALPGADMNSAEPARVLRLPGTFNRKPEYGEPRPVVLEALDPRRRYTLDAFDACPPAASARTGVAAGPFVLPERIGEGRRNDTLYRLARKLRVQGLPAPALLAALLEENRTRCVPPLDDAEVRVIADHATEQPDRPGFLRAPAHLTDLGNARFLVARYGADLRYVPAWKSWLSWEGTHWQRSDRGQAEQRAKRAVADLYAEASAETNDERRRQLVGHALRSESAGALRAMLELAQTEAGIPARPEDLDRDAWLLNVANGTLNLRSAALRPHHREDLITKLIPIPYDAAAPAPKWYAFLTRILAGNARLIAFLQRAIGSALTGDTSDQVFFILWGQGANGKSTLIKTLMHILAGYAGQMATETLLRQRGGDAMLGLNDLATLHGARFVAAMEADMGRPLAEALVKQLTGGDTIKVKRLYRDVFPIEPTFKIFLSTNHRPEIRGTEHAIWRRVRLIPFTVTIPEAEQDKHLFERLSAEAPGILAWAVAGCLAWQRDGLGAPEEVRSATTAYRTEQDVVGRFLAERCVIDASGRIGAAQMARVYRAWAESTGEEALSAKALKARLAAQGLKQKTTAQGAFWLGLRLRAPREPLSPPSPERTSMVDMVGAGGFSQNSSRESALGKSSPDTHQHPPSTMPPLREPETSAPAEERLEDLFPIEPPVDDCEARLPEALAIIRAVLRPRRG